MTPEDRAALVEKLPAAVEAILAAADRCAACGWSSDTIDAADGGTSHNDLPHCWEDADLVAVLREALGLGETTGENT